MNTLSKDEQSNKIRSIVDSYLQFSFFLSFENNIYYCDEAGRLFWECVGPDEILPHIEILKFNSAISNTSIMVNDTSFSLRLLPLNNKANLPSDVAEYVVVLQNQTLFSSLINKLNAAAFPKDLTTLDSIFANVSNGLFLVDIQNSVMYVNQRYEEITGLSRNKLLGQNIYELEKSGILSTLISPTIMETYDDFTAYQVLSSGKHAIISGSIVCNTHGDPVCTLTCPSIITNPKMDTLSKHLLASSLSRSTNHKNYRQSQIDIIAESEEMRTTIAEVLRIAHYSVPVLLLGESGTGKEVIATLLHNSSRARHGRFIKINCSALPSTLLETELFGYEPGAFTGALARGKKGLFEEANNGTILLDEIGDMPLESQAKLLRVLQEGEIYRVGGTASIKVNARIIAATNRDLRGMVDNHSFREDLYHRLNVIPIVIQPLRKRRADIIPLILHYSYYFNKKYGVSKTFSSQLLDIMSRYDWPGNTRELRNMVERLTLTCCDDTLTVNQFYVQYPDAKDTLNIDTPAVVIEGIIPLKEAVLYVEKELIRRALEKSGSSRGAATLLGVSQSTIVRKASEYNINLKRPMPS